MAFEGVTTQTWRPEPLALGLSLIVSYLIGTVIYRLWFHPLAQYPGPFWARITAIPAWWHTRNQYRHLWLLSLQEKYGPEFRYQPNEVCINTPTGYRQIYGPRGNVRKSDSYKVWRRTIDALNTWSTISNDLHAQKRRVLNYAFSEAAMRSAEPFVHANVDRWIELLSQQKKEGNEWSDSIDMSDHVTYLVFDILGDLCFGKCFDMKEPGSDLRYVPKTLTGFLKIIHPIACAPWKFLWVWLKPKGLDHLLALTAPAAVKSWEGFVVNCQENRAKKQKQHDVDKKPESEARKDFFHWLWEAKDPETGKRLSIAELNSECELLVLAGSDTTATVISALLFYLSRNKRVQEELTNEILSTFSSYNDIKAGTKLLSCRYLTAFIQEGMRMAPPFGANAIREVLQGGITIQGRYLPKGTLVSTATWAMQYNSDYFPEPTQFRPERWMVGEQGSTEESVALAESAFCTFSTGPRGCVGKNMAWLEMRIVLAKLVWKFHVRQDPRSGNLGGGSPRNREWGRRCEDQYQTWDISVADRKGPLVQLRERIH